MPATHTPPSPAGAAESSSTVAPISPSASAIRRAPAYQSWLPRTAKTPRGAAASGARRAISSPASTGRAKIARRSMKSPSRQTRSGRSAASASAARWTASRPACGMPAWRSVMTPTRRPSSVEGQCGSVSSSRRTRSDRGSIHAAQTPRAASAAAPGARCLALLVVVAAADVAEVTEVVEAAPGRPEAGPDLLQLGRVERGAEALQALAVVEPELGGEVVALEQADVVDPTGERLSRLDLDRAVP